MEPELKLGVQCRLQGLVHVQGVKTDSKMQAEVQLESGFHLLIVQYLSSYTIIALQISTKVKVGIWCGLMNGFSFDLVVPRTSWPVL